MGEPKDDLAGAYEYQTPSGAYRAARVTWENGYYLITWADGSYGTYTTGEIDQMITDRRLFPRA